LRCSSEEFYVGFYFGAVSGLASKNEGEGEGEKIGEKGDAVCLGERGWKKEARKKKREEEK
jgi:hypothetical protein